ncbi:MAG: phosphatidate cytidylyltransferase [Saprospiraceae bacterium]|nr:phosphatidate cytidylyltransferase [Saprospiraceae bacterium]MDZ4702447.1 phosphatidate cytidylyltransferase [Saprospiraceae bacterium]
MSTLGRRMITGSIFVAVMTAGIYGGAYTFLGLFGLIATLSLWEFYGLALDVTGISGKVRRVLGVLTGLGPFLFMAIQVLLNKDTPYILGHGLLGLLLVFFVLMLLELRWQSESPFHNLAFLALGIVYIGTPFALMVAISFPNGETYQPNIMMGLLLLSWANDSGAYGIGSRIGKTQLAPHISPKKTWEGAIGGCIITLLAAILFANFIPGFTYTDWIVLSLIVVVLGSLGDLVESLFKRSLQIKDSGKLLPGHGGLLDRFDGLIFIVPFVSAYLFWIK